LANAILGKLPHPQKDVGHNLYNAKRKKSKCVILENAIRKYGAENFTIEAIYICIIKDLNSAERGS